MSGDSKNKLAKVGKMDRSKELALPVLARESNLTKAAREIGVDREQLYKWLRDEEYRKKVDDLRTDLVNDAISTLKASASKAVTTLVDLMSDDSPQIRLKSANDILDRISKFIEIQDISVRLRELEKTVQRCF